MLLDLASTVYVVASPSPALYVYPSQVHPRRSPRPVRPAVRPKPLEPKPYKPENVVYRDSGRMSFTVTAHGTARTVRGTGSRSYPHTVTVRVPRWEYLTLPFEALDLLLGDFDA